MQRKKGKHLTELRVDETKNKKVLRKGHRILPFLCFAAMILPNLSHLNDLKSLIDFIFRFENV